jgi:uncharacterized membrane protein
MRDRSVQVVLGTFIATFLYCLLVLRTVRRVEEDAFVPQVAVSVALVMAVLSLGVLIYFVHHVSISIQADEIISRISRELVGGIDGMYPDGIGTGGPPVVATPGSGGRRAITAPRDGYVQIIEAKRLLQAAATHDVVVVLTRRPGHYVIAGSPIAEVSPGGRVTEEVADAITTAIVIGGRRSPAQDVEFSINQLVEIAVRALSPGVNDPFTAIACVDRLGSALCRVGRREPPASQRRDDQGVVRVIAEPLTFGALADAAFNQIRQTSVATVAVTIRLLETITAVAACLGRDEDRAVLRRHADMIVAGAREAITEAADRLDVEGRYLAAVDALAARTGTLTNHGFVE